VLKPGPLTGAPPARAGAANHRISKDLTSIQQVLARGWKNEGIVMCAPL
jgi:hypothetical protein